MRGIKLYNPDVAASEKLAERLFSDGMPEGISVIYRGRNTVGVLPGPSQRASSVLPSREW